MPYVITTLNTALHGEPMEDQSAADVDGATRTAVATLDEARATILTDLGDRNAITGPEDALCGAVHDLSEASGGTIALPDETVIEVRQASKFTIGFEAGLIAPDHPNLWPMDDLLAKFNRTGRFAGDPA